MALYDDPPHRVSVYTSTSSKDDGKGVQLAWTLVQAAVPCVINTASASQRASFAQQGIIVSHCVGFLSETLTTQLTRKMKLVADDTGASYSVEGVRNGREMGGIPALSYADVNEIL